MIERYAILPRIVPTHLNIQLSNKIRGNQTIHDEFRIKNILFTHIPKAAGSSIGEAILGHDRVGHYPARYIKRLDPVFFEKCFKFTIIRNPWDRLYSAYYFLKSGGKGSWDSIWAEKNKISSMSFEKFVLDFIDPISIYSIIHLAPQTDFIYDQNGKQLINHIGRLESLQEDLLTLSKLSGLKIPLVHSNKTNKKPYTEIYTSEMKKKVQLVYAKDICLLNYEY